MRKLYFLFFVLCSVVAVKAQIINFPDPNFKAKLLEADVTNWIATNYEDGAAMRIDANNNGEIEVSEALNVGNLYITGLSITNLEGVGYFSNLRDLTCTGTQVSNVNLSGLIVLDWFRYNNNQATSLNIIGGNVSDGGDPSNTESYYVVIDCDNNPLLNNLQVSDVDAARGWITCKNNQLTNLTISDYPNLETIRCNNNLLTSINLTGINTLDTIDCSNNQLTSLNLSDHSRLSFVYCSNNSLTSLVFPASMPYFNDLYCDNNQLTTIEITNAPYFATLIANNNNLTTIYAKCGAEDVVFPIDYWQLANNPNLRYICVDDHKVDYAQQVIDGYGYYCEVNSYCTFNPGGEFFTINGNTKLDLDNNGCDAADQSFPNLKFNVSNGTTNRTIISDASGNYNIPVLAGTYTVTPVLENPTYFTISPSSVTVTFPGQSSPLTQNFCVDDITTPDLEIFLLPVGVARPGFDITYKIIFKNKGNIVQSGTVNLNFDDAIMDFVSASQVVTNQTVNNLSWDFINLQPLETREIILTLNLNSPMEIPAVNGGDVLNYMVSISSPETDVTPFDNEIGLSQTVVNSYDPNDKTCLEGTTIAPSEVGKYVHYLIRFENTGTYPAENIVVKDNIDTNKFDISSLVPIDGSHDFYTRINGNKVEFIFENINLPFDDANNDGYVAFKIKTKPTLVNGDTFSNSASIYFDYNFPIVTNTATTTVQALSTQDFEFGQYFNLYPNPVNNVLNIETKQAIEVTSISIYNQLGQLVIVVPSAQNVKSVDVSSLASGNYFIKINSDRGISNAKFVKR